ncbi:MAG: glycosyltransferase family 2 protein [candidate division WOR-3 bacterium]|nr:MAG: glycosyltransferase family 2 protein [candidate division WOR-3 bacterium]
MRSKKKASARRFPLVYVLILNWNGKSLTIDCVESLMKSDYPNFRTLVIDNGSTDGSADALEKRFGGRIKIIENGKNLGYAGGFNVGLRYAFGVENSDYCLIMNNDTVIDRSAISEYVMVAESHEKIGFVTGKVYYYDSPNILQTVGKKEDPVRWSGGHIGKGEVDRGQYDTACERYFADDIFTLVSKRLFEDTGGYDPTFFLQSEEYDWQARAKKFGYRIMYTPGAKIWHKESMTIGRDSARKAYYDARNPMVVVLLHRSPDFFRRYFWLHVRKDIILSSLRYLKHGRLSVAIAKAQGLFAGLSWGIRNRRMTLKHLL